MTSGPNPVRWGEDITDEMYIAYLCLTQSAMSASFYQLTCFRNV